MRRMATWGREPNVETIGAGGGRLGLAGTGIIVGYVSQITCLVSQVDSVAREVGVPVGSLSSALGIGRGESIALLGKCIIGGNLRVGNVRVGHIELVVTVVGKAELIGAVIGFSHGGSRSGLLYSGVEGHALGGTAEIVVAATSHHHRCSSYQKQ